MRIALMLFLFNEFLNKNLRFLDTKQMSRRRQGSIGKSAFGDTEASGRH